MLTIDGSYGEGGGQILRTALTLSAITGQAVELTNIRSNRSKPGLRPQHLTAVRAAAAICDAQVEGDQLDSERVTFAPQTPPQSGTYTFDVADVAQGGSAGSVTLILQTLLLPLALAAGTSNLRLQGGTTVPMSPPTLYIEQIYLPTLFEMGVRARIERHRWGFYPLGGGELQVQIQGGTTLLPLRLAARGPAERVRGVAFVSRLPSHIPQRMTNRATSLLEQADLPQVHIEPRHVTAPGIGAGIFLALECELSRTGFLTLGRRGLPSEDVAEMACDDLLAYYRTTAAVDPHLGDQLVLPFALVDGTSTATVSRITRHLRTNVWLVNRFGFNARVEGEDGEPGELIVAAPSDRPAPA
jgi:RNA 3'-terminal phosphate cyclase (ATP)